MPIKDAKINFDGIHNDIGVSDKLFINLSVNTLWSHSLIKILYFGCKCLNIKSVI